MKHTSSRELYAYWNGRRGKRMAPDRADIEPGAIRRALGDSFILAFDPAGGHPFRLAGTRLCGLFNSELRNEAFDSLWAPENRQAVHDLVLTVADEMAGVVAGATGYTPEGYTIDLEFLLLPLRHGGNTHARQMGVIAPLTSPYWLGSSPIIELTLGSHRHLLAETTQAPVPHPNDPTSRVRHGFLVYDGGRADQ